MKWSQISLVTEAPLKKLGGYSSAMFKPTADDRAEHLLRESATPLYCLLLPASPAHGVDRRTMRQWPIWDGRDGEAPRRMSDRLPAFEPVCELDFDDMLNW